ncbi:MAG: hypothetical protein P8188_03480 [Gemmatimonadota bacterium]|jgi:lipoate-protein ligase A
MTDPVAWSVWIDGPRSGAENMAWDHTLALALPENRGVLRLYRWIRPTLSLGRNEPARDVFDPGRLQAAGIDLVRRPTGGRSVLHHHELTYAVVAPIRALGGVRAAYALVNHGLAAGLAAWGVEVGLARGEAALKPDAGACFQGPANGEVVAGGRKLVGSAQVRVGGVLLQHGSILLRDDQARIATFRRADGTPSGPPTPGACAPRDRSPETNEAGVGVRAAAALEDLLGRSVAPGEVAASVIQGLQGALPGNWRPVTAGHSLEEVDLPAAPAPELLERYRSPDWSWRR